MTTQVEVAPQTTIIEVANVIADQAPLIQANSVSVNTNTTGFIDASTVQGAFEQLGAGALFTSSLATKLAGIEPGATAIPDQAGHASKFLTTDGFGNLSWAVGGQTGGISFTGNNISAADFGTISFQSDTNFTQDLTIDSNAVATESYVDTEVAGVIPADAGHTGKFLTTDGLGNLSWSAATGGGGTAANTGNLTFSGNVIGTNNNQEISFAVGGDFTALQINNEAVATQSYASTQATTAANGIIPAQSSHTGKFLTTDGTNLSWATVSGGGGNANTGNVTFTGSTMSTSDNSDIVFAQDVQMASFTTTSTGIPTLTSGSHVNISAVDGLKVNNVSVEPIPDQSTHSGKFLTTNGTALSWATVSSGGAANTGNVTFSGSTINTSDSSVIDFDAAVTFTNATAPKIGTTTIATTTDVDNVLPSDSGHANKYLKADGNGNLSWSTVSGSTTGNVTFTNSTVTTTDSAIDFDSPVTFTNAADPQINGVDIATVTDVNNVLPTYGVAQANKRLGVDGSGNLQWQTVDAGGGGGNANTGTLTFNNSTVNTSDSSDIIFAADVVFSGGLQSPTIRSTDATATKSIVSGSDFEITAPDGVTANGIPLPSAGGMLTLGASPTWTGSSNVTVSRPQAGTYRISLANVGSITLDTHYVINCTFNQTSGTQTEVNLNVVKTGTYADIKVFDGSGSAVDVGTISALVYEF